MMWKDPSTNPWITYVQIPAWITQPFVQCYQQVLLLSHPCLPTPLELL
jgi:hypothetical protein